MDWILHLTKLAMLYSDSFVRPDEGWCNQSEKKEKLIQWNLVQFWLLSVTQHDVSNALTIRPSHLPFCRYAMLNWRGALCDNPNNGRKAGFFIRTSYFICHTDTELDLHKQHKYSRLPLCAACSVPCERS